MRFRRSGWHEITDSEKIAGEDVRSNNMVEGSRGARCFDRFDVDMSML